MSHLLLVLILMLATPALAGPAEDWCREEARYLSACLETAQEDHAACSDQSGVSYSYCRGNRLLMRRMKEGTPSGDVERADCTLPGGIVIRMNVRNCLDQGGKVAPSS